MNKEHILEVAYTMARHDGFGTLTRDGVAAEARVVVIPFGGDEGRCFMASFGSKVEKIDGTD